VVNFVIISFFLVIFKKIKPPICKDLVLLDLLILANYATQTANDNHLVLQDTKISANAIAIAANHYLLLDVGWIISIIIINWFKHGRIKRKTTITETVNEVSDAKMSNPCN